MRVAIIFGILKSLDRTNQNTAPNGTNKKRPAFAGLFLMRGLTLASGRGGLRSTFGQPGAQAPTDEHQGQADHQDDRQDIESQPDQGFGDALQGTDQGFDGLLCDGGAVPGIDGEW